MSIQYNTIQSKRFEQHRMQDHLIDVSRMVSLSLSQDRLTTSGKEKIQTFLRLGHSRKDPYPPPTEEIENNPLPPFGHP
jgi:hypothetical protein